MWIIMQLSADRRSRLLRTTERQNQTTDRLRDSHRTMLETEDLGVSILHDLHQQRQSLLHAHDTVSYSYLILSVWTNWFLFFCDIYFYLKIFVSSNTQQCGNAYAIFSTEIMIKFLSTLMCFVLDEVYLSITVYCQVNIYVTMDTSLYVYTCIYHMFHISNAIYYRTRIYLSWPLLTSSLLYLAWLGFTELFSLFFI